MWVVVRAVVLLFMHAHAYAGVSKCPKIQTRSCCVCKPHCASSAAVQESMWLLCLLQAPSPVKSPLSI